jgi:hypothetical protein
MQKFQELLVLFRRRPFELLMPAPHVVFTETGGAHNRCPLFFGDHVDSPQLICAAKQPGDGTLVLAEALDARADLGEAAA